jgi:hypothetical protein
MENTFHYLAPVTKAFIKETQVGDKTIVERFMEVTLSGIKEDRDGDRVDMKAIDGMINQLNSGKVPFYLNHGLDKNGERSYRVEDMAGVWTAGYKEGDNMIATVKLNSANPAADIVWNYYQAGMPLGFSIGGRIIAKHTENVEVSGSAEI